MSRKRDTLPKTGLELRDWLVSLFLDFVPGFGDEWHYEPDGTLTPHHVCSEFTGYYRKHIADYDAPAVVEMFRVTEVINAADPLDFDPVANALCTCFLENIAHSEPGESGRRHMSRNSRRFFDFWHRGYVPRLAGNP